jgi:SAM-dependent methyltransferase
MPAFSSQGVERMDHEESLGITEQRKRMFAYQIGDCVSHDAHALENRYFDKYSDNLSYEEAFEDLFNGKYIVDLIQAIWHSQPPYKLLDCGSANGLTLEEFAEIGVEAWGIENNAHIHSRTPDEWRARNLLGDVLKLPFDDDSFDFVYVTCLPYLPEERIDEAIKELLRVCRIGLIFHGVTTDMTEEVIREYLLFRGVRTFWTFSEWSNAFLRHGFRQSVADSALLEEIWRIEQETDEDDWNWYPDKESMQYSFFSKSG